MGLVGVGYRRMGVRDSGHAFTTTVVTIQPHTLVYTTPVSCSLVGFTHNTCELLVLSLGGDGTGAGEQRLTTPAKAPAVVWQARRLPSDAFAVIAVAEPLGGALVLTPSALLFVNNVTRKGLSFNGLECHHPHVPASVLCLCDCLLLSAMSHTHSACPLNLAKMAFGDSQALFPV